MNGRRTLFAVLALTLTALSTIPPASAGILTGTDVALADGTAGATTTATVSFTTILGLGVSDKVEVTFPAGFDVSGVGAGDGACSSMDGTFVTSVAGQVVTITRQGDGSIQVAAAETCTIANVVNPAVSGSTGTYGLRTLDLIDTLLDSATVAADTITAAALAASDVQPASLVAGATGAVTASFTTVNPIPADGVVRITFPAGFDVSGASLTSCSFDGTNAIGIAGQVVSITRNGDGTATAAGAHNCVLGGVQNPQVSGSTGTYALQTLSAGLAAIDQDLAVAADTIVAAALAASDVQPASLVAGAVGAVTAGFTSVNPLPADGVVRITFPAGFDVSGASLTSCSFDGTNAIGIAGQVVSITRNGDGTATTAGAHNCVLGGVQNPGAAGSTGTYAIEVLSAGLAAIDQDLAVAADTIVAAALAGASVTPSTLFIGRTTTATVAFTNSLPVPIDGAVQVVFPAGFDVSGASGGTCSSMDGTFATAIAGQTVTITRQGDGSIAAAGAQTCTIGGIVNPTTVGAAGTYAVSLLDGSLATIEEDLAVAASSFYSGGGGGSTSPVSSSTDGTVRTVAFTFGGLGIDRVEVEVPDGTTIQVTASSLGDPGDVPSGFAGTDRAFTLTASDPAAVRAVRIDLSVALSSLPASTDPQHLVLLHGLSDGSWEAWPTTVTVDGTTLRIHAEGASMSPFWLVEDMQAPTVDLAVEGDEIVASWSDNQGSADAVLYIDGEPAQSVSDGSGLRVSTTDLSPGTHDAELVATDPAGYESRQATTFSVAEPSADSTPAAPQEQTTPSDTTDEPATHDTPGFSALLVALALLGGALLRRRR